MLRLGGPIHIQKFPRTPHLINLGAVTEDDILAATPELTGHLTIEEKMDGFNMGFSLDMTGQQILVQNRSHYVNHTTHAQFKPLQSWLTNNTKVLTKLLYLGPDFPERNILYGEWMVATHSIPYTHLPTQFIAFDFYDRQLKQFVLQSMLKRILEGPGLI